jgi:hypothetical protein
MTAERGPAVIHVAIDPDSDCLPMFKPGTPARCMITRNVAEGTRLVGLPGDRS